MQVITNDMMVMFDCDDTLVMWNNVNYWVPGPDKYEFIDSTDGGSAFLQIHKAHVNLLKKYKAQGYTVVVWSAAGYRWAESVVKTLQLEDYVDMVMSKPIKYVDDLSAKEILGSRVYIPFGIKDKEIPSGDAE
jgi:FMN phosphatase YigB (HAD superfamily)